MYADTHTHTHTHLRVSLSSRDITPKTDADPTHKAGAVVIHSDFTDFVVYFVYVVIDLFSCKLRAH